MSQRRFTHHLPRAALAATVVLLAAMSSTPFSQEIQLKSLLVDTQSGASGGAALQQGDLKRFFEAEKLLVYQILSQLKISKDSLPKNVREAIDKPQTTSFEAFQAFARGIDLADQGRYADARDAFNEAARLDPGFVLARGLSQAMPPQNLPGDAALGNAVGSYNARAAQTGAQLAETALANGSIPIGVGGSSSPTGAGVTTTIPLDQCQVDPIYCYLSGTGANSSGPTDPQTVPAQNQPRVVPPGPPPPLVAGAPQTYAAITLMQRTVVAPTPPPLTSDSLLAPYVSASPVANPAAGFTVGQIGSGGTLTVAAPTLQAPDTFPISNLLDGGGVLNQNGVLNPTGALAGNLNQGSHTILTDAGQTGAAPANYLGEWYPLTFAPLTGAAVPGSGVTVPFGTSYAVLAAGTEAGFAILASPTPQTVLDGLFNAQSVATYTYNVPIALQGSINLDTGGYGPRTVYSQPIVGGTVTADLRYGAGSMAIQNFTLTANGPTIVAVPQVAGPQAQFTFALNPIAPTAVNRNGSFALNGTATIFGSFSNVGTDFVKTDVTATGAQANIAGQVSGLRAGALLGVFGATGGTVTTQGAFGLTPIPVLSAQGVFAAGRR